MANLAFIGLGRMGYPMAGHLARNGHKVSVFNRSHARAQAWVAEHAGRAAAAIADAVSGADMAFMCVGDDPDIRDVAREAFPAMKPGSILVDHTTGSATLAAELAHDAAARGLHFLDAPVSGGEAGAQKGQLTVMCGGDSEAYAAAEPVIRAYAKMVRRLGPAGAGQKTKMVNQICIAGLVQALAEGVHFAEKAGLDPDAVIDVISKGAAQSWQMENRAGTMHQRRFDFGFAVSWMRKDLRIALAEARQNGATLPVTSIVDQFYADVERMGGQRWDTSSLIARLSDRAEG
ncbi:MAG: NAD(P)-dependent oxidoreductase [Alphaproteobacteria bacterium]|nr:NAD(P)-dependent oxidoreductase [Alphaproteobacteria bacterium]